MIQDIAPHVFHNEYSLKRKAKPTDYVFVFDANNILICGDGVNTPLSLPEASHFNSDDLLYLFSIDETAYYLYVSEIQCTLDGYEYLTKRVLRSDNPRLVCFAAFTAYQLYNWYSTNRYCGRCGTLTEHSDTERALICPHCSNTIYPKIAPAVIVGVTDGDRVVITRYKDRIYKGIALIAGFCEIGETPEMTAIREVKEEVGLSIKDLEYVGSQPWGIDSNLLIGFTAKLDGDSTIVRDQNELSEALWVKRSDLELPDSDISLTRTLIIKLKKGEC
ncbi:MAG: NAD(+) diphosphatase [Succinivibrio sp.]